jgi:hypothetical protein
METLISFLCFMCSLWWSVFSFLYSVLYFDLHHIFHLFFFKLHLLVTHEWFSISSNTNGACESRKVLPSYIACNELFNWLENRFSYHMIFVSFNSNWSFWWRLSFHSFGLCVVCDDKYIAFCIVYCILNYTISFTCSGSSLMNLLIFYKLLKKLRLIWV